MIRNYTIQLKPTVAQAAKLAQHGGARRWVWNHMLAANQEQHKADGKFIFRFDMQKMLPDLKKAEQTAWLKDINSQTLQSACLDLDRTLRRSFSKTKAKAGFPKFKSKQGNDSFVVPQNWNFGQRSVYLPKIGKVKFEHDRKFEGKIKQIVVKQRLGKWIAVVSCELPDVPQQPEFCEAQVVGLDHGLTSFTTTSDGLHIANPRWMQQKQAKLKRYQRQFARKSKGSNNRAKHRAKLAKLHAHVANQRKDFHNKLAHDIVSQYPVVAIEDLNIKGMARNRMGKSIADVGWASFNEKLANKLEKVGGMLIKIDRFTPTTKTCNNCGQVHDMPLDKRVMDCDCGHIEDRDVNAARNIRRYGILEANRVGTTRIYACGGSAVLDPTKHESVARWCDPICSLDKW